MNRVEEAFARYKKIWGNEAPGSEHSSVLYPDEVKRLLDMGKHFAEHEDDEKYLSVFYAFGAGYMLGYEEGCKLKE